MTPVPASFLDRHRLKVAFVLALLATGLSIATAISASPSDPGGPFRVLFTSPQGEVETLSSIDIVFSQPMVPAGDRHREAKRAPLIIEPPIKGSFFWIAGRALTFVPEVDIPPGTRLVCRIEKDTKSLDGKTLVSDREWEIVVGRPSLERSLPADQGRFAPKGTIHLMFNRAPDTEAENMIHLFGPAGEIGLERVSPDTLAVTSLLSHRPTEGDLEKVIALLPSESLSPDEEYSIRIDASISSAASSVGMNEPTVVSFRTFGQPGIEMASVDADGITVSLESPVNPDDLLRRLDIAPAIANRLVRTEDNRRFRIEGDLEPGQFYVVSLRPGLKSIHGVALSGVQRALVETPHRRSSLAIVPSEGCIAWTGDAAIRIEATNLDTISILGAWVPPGNVPGLLASDRQDSKTIQLLPVARWFRPREVPDSAHVFEIPVKEFGKPPRGARILRVQAAGRSLFADDRFFAVHNEEALVQFTNLGLSSFIGHDKSVACVVGLSTGEAEENAEIRLHAPHVDEPLWSGKSQADGLVRMPGMAELPIEPSSELIIEAKAGGDAAWLAIAIGDLKIADFADTTTGKQLRAHIVTDRTYYRAGESVRSVLFVRTLGLTGIEPADSDSVVFTVTSVETDTELVGGQIDLAHPGNGGMSFAIPTTAAAGAYRLSTQHGTDRSDQVFASTILNIIESSPPSLETRAGRSEPIATSKKLDSHPDHAMYSPGDTAQVLLPTSGAWSEGFVLVLDDGIRSVLSLPSDQSASGVAIPLRHFYPPGIYVHALLYGPGPDPRAVDTTKPLPYLGHGRTYLKISPDRWRLDVDVATDREVYESGAEVAVDITVLDASGNPASGSVTLAVVDDAMLGDADRPESDPLSTFFAPRGEGVVHGDTRIGLMPRAQRPDDVVSSRMGTDTPADLAAYSSSTPTVLWKPFTPLDTDGKTTIRFKLQDAEGRYRLRVTAESGGDRFGYGESLIEGVKGLLLDCNAPGFVRDGDRTVIAATVANNLDRTTQVQIGIEAEGARIDGKENVSIKIKPGERGHANFQLVDPRGEEIVLRLRASTEEHSDAIEVTVPVDRPVVWDRSFNSGRVDPVARTVIKIPEGSLSDLGGLTTVISPSMLGGLDDALSTVIDDTDACLECLSNSLLGLTARDQIKHHLGERGETTETDRVARAREIVASILECVERSEVKEWPLLQASEASDHIVGYALYAASRAHADYPIPSSLMDRLADEAEVRLQRLWQDASDDEEKDRLLQVGPWLMWTISEMERLRSSESTRLGLREVGGLFNMRAQAPMESRVLLGLLLTNLRKRPDTADYHRGWTSSLHLLMGEIKAEGVERIGRFSKLSGSGEAWDDGFGNDVCTNAMYLRLLANTDPGDEDLPGIIAWLLGQRRQTSGAWLNNQTTALTLDQLASTVVNLEGPPGSITGTVALGGKFEDYQFGSQSRPVNRKHTPVQFLIGADGAESTHLFRVESDGRRMVYFSTTLDCAQPALDIEPREQGLLLDRSYVDARGELLDDGIPLSEPIFVRLDVVVPEDAKALTIEDHLPAGIEALNRRPHSSASGIRISHSEIDDTMVRLYVEDLPAGIHQIRYPAIATTAGEYRVPGARAELPYNLDTYAISAAQTVRVIDER